MARKRKKKTEHFFVISMIAVCWACGDGGDLFDTVPAELAQLTPTYERHIEPLLSDYCVSCHASNGPIMGGVELDRYESAHSGRIRNTCVAVQAEVVRRYSDLLTPQPRDPPSTRQPCEGWEPYSMPTGAKLRMKPSEQILLIRWLETGAMP